jgi:hypothetical protein
MYQATEYAPQRSDPRIGEWISEAFTLFGREWQTWVGQGAILLFVGFGPMFVGMIIYYAAFFGAMATSSRGSGTMAPEALGGMFAGMGAMFVGSFVSMFLFLFLMIGMERTALKQLRGEPITVKDVFSGGDLYLPILGASLLMGLASMLGSIFCIIPGLLISGMLSFTLPIMVEERLGPMEAMSKSWEATKPHMWMYLLWYFLISLVMSVGAYACYVGYVATVPIYMLAMMIAYRDVFGLAGAVPRATAVPTVPQVPVVDYGPAGAPVTGARCPACERPVAVGAVMCPHCQSAIPPGYTG